MKTITRVTMTVALLLMAVTTSWAGIKTSASDIGKVIATNGKVYADAAAATADGAEAVAMIVWFNAAGTEGLAIGYKDVEDYGLLWDDFYTYLDDEIYARGWNKNANKVTGATWITPTAYQWMDALKGCGSTSTKVDPVTDTYPFLLGNLNTMLGTAGFDEMSGGQHWTSTTTGGNYVLYNTTSKKFEYHTTSESWYGFGRLFLSFDVENNSLGDANDSDLGKVITTDGHIFATVSAATAAGETPVAMIAYVGTTEGLAIELDINGPVTQVTAINALDPPYYPAVTGAGDWHIPSITEWQLMAAAFEGTAYDSAVDPDCGYDLNFNTLGATLAAVGGATNFNDQEDLWSTTQPSDVYLCANPLLAMMTCSEADDETYHNFMAVIPFTLTPDPTPQRTVYLAGNDYTKVIVKAGDTKKTVEANTGSGADVVSGKAVIGGTTATTVTVAPKEGYMFSAIKARKDYVIDVKELTVSNFQAEDGMVLTGNTSSNTNIVVPAGATITLRNLDITNLEKGKNTITFEGDANVILEGTNYVAYGNSQNPTIPAISFAPGSTVKFSGSGTLLAYAYQNKAEGFSDIVSDGVTLDISGLTGSGSVKQQPMFTAPTTKTGLIYDGSNQELVNVGTTSGGTMQYSANGESLWSASLPTGKNAGTYSVYYRIEGSGFYADMVKQKLSPNPVIAKAVAAAPTAIGGLSYTGSAMNLINKSSCPFMQYSLDGVNYSYDVPQGTNAGNYTVYYIVPENTNYETTSPNSVAAKIGKSNGYFTLQTGIPVNGSDGYVSTTNTVNNISGFSESDFTVTIVDVIADEAKKAKRVSAVFPQLKFEAIATDTPRTIVIRVSAENANYSYHEEYYEWIIKK